jgi:hypothetical protein
VPSPLPESIDADKSVLGIDMKIYKAPLFTFRGRLQMWAYGNMICTSESSIQTPETKDSDGSFSAQGRVATFEVNYEPKCIFYVERFFILDSVSGGGSKSYNQPVYDILAMPSSGGQLDLSSDIGSQLSISPTPLVSNMLLNVKFVTGQPDVTIKSVEQISFQGGNALRFVIQNSGDYDVNLNDIVEVATGLPLTILNKPDVIAAHSQVDVFAKGAGYSISPNQFDLQYRTVDIGCLPAKDYSTLRLSVQCTSSAQCVGSANICCGGGCRDPSKGICRDVNGDGSPEWIIYRQ